MKVYCQNHRTYMTPDPWGFGNTPTVWRCPEELREVVTIGDLRQTLGNTLDYYAGVVYTFRPPAPTRLIGFTGYEHPGAFLETPSSVTALPTPSWWQRTLTKLRQLMNRPDP